ncbi:hypothetical protein GCM10009847_22080 [Leucobacter tardus]
MLLTRRGIGVLLSGAAIGAAWFAVGIRDLWYLSAFLLALVAIAVVTVLVLPLTARLSPTLSTIDPTPMVGARFPVTVRVHQRFPVPIPVELEWASGGGRHRLLAARSDPSARAVTCTAHRRGPLTVGVGALLVKDPLALARRRVPSGAGLDVLVLPALLQHVPEPLGGVSAHGASSAPAGRSVGQVSGEPSGSVREYRTGDAIRQVHWKQSARQGQLLVNLPEDAEAAERTLLLDTDPSHYGDERVAAARDERFERAVSTAATLAVQWLGDGHPVRLIVGSGDPRPVATRDDALMLLARAVFESPTHERPRPRIDAVVTGVTNSDSWKALPDSGVAVYRIDAAGSTDVDR